MLGCNKWGSGYHSGEEVPPIFQQTTWSSGIKNEENVSFAAAVESHDESWY